MSNFFLKYKTEGAVLPPFIANECVLKYFKQPFNNCGMVIDSFPYCIEDSEIILKDFAIPDVIIELKCDFNDSENRLLEILLPEWQLAQNQMKADEEARFANEMDDFIRKKESWMRSEEIKIYKKRKFDASEFENDILEESSLVSSESSEFSDFSDLSEVITIEEKTELEKRFYKLFPQPELLDDWEGEESAKERFSMQIEDEYEKVTQNLSFLHSFFKNETIPWIEVDARPEINEVFLKILYILTPYSRRNLSLLEKTYEVDNLTAEHLLSLGYYFLSSFGRFCPVQVFNKNNPFQMFLSLASQEQIFTVLHRQFIYFLAGKEALTQFKAHPLKYIAEASQIPMIPAIISIIGPPKCGKTTLSKRFSSTYGFEAISRDEVISYILNNLPDTSLSKSIRKMFQNGESASPHQIAALAKLFLSNSQCVTQGCIFDGFPSSIEEAEALASLAISPVIIIDLEAPLDFTLECFEADEDVLFLTSSQYQEYEEWKLDAEEFRTWLNECTGNLVKIDATRSKAAVWRRADEAVRYRFAKFLKYVRDAGYDKVRDLEFLCVTPLGIQARTGRFRLFCPSCVYYYELFKGLDISKSRKGLVQFRQHYYWFCEAHLQSFRRDPNRYLRLFEKLELPDDYPQVITDVIDLENDCWSRRLVNNGYCLVTYVDNLPNRKLALGKPNLAALYQGYLYLFSTETHRQKFCEKFRNYVDVRIHFPQTLGPLEPKKLPALGFLEQSVAASIAKAVNRVGELRPKLPGMSPSVSAAVFVGLYLKAGQKSSREKLPYEAAMRKMQARCDLMQVAVEGMKKRLNPWIEARGYVEEEIEVAKREESKGAEESRDLDLFGMVGVKFRRTSPTQLLLETDESSEEV